MNLSQQITKLTLSMTTALAMAVATTLTLASCSSKITKADISSSANPQEEIAKLDVDLKEAQKNNVDVLAFKDFDKSIKALEDAKKDLAAGKKQERIIDSLRYGRAYLDSGTRTADARRSQVPSLLEARQMAFQAGASAQPQLQKEWTKTDREVISNAENLAKVDAAELTELQNRYVDLERKSTIIKNLSEAQAQIAGAKNDRAEKRAPKTLKMAEMQYSNAESAISANVRSPSVYEKAVQEAASSSLLLSDVMNQISKSSTKNLSEASATAMVMQTRKIADLNHQMVEQKDETESAKSDVRNKNAQLERNGMALKESEASVNLQRALERARSSFSNTEAEAYQQGENLVIRLKTMSFASGRADLPAASLMILAKVTDVAKDLGANSIRVEGHTDSMGGEAKNQTLSENRATAVATYFKTNGFSNVSSEGFGLSKPLAPNKTAVGRAQNRRVDIVMGRVL